MDPSVFDRLRELIEQHDTFVHVTHVNPDADGIGSALAFHRWLAGRGKRSQVLLASPLPRRLAFLAEPGELATASTAQAVPADAALLVYDVSSARRLGPFADAVRRTSAPVVVLDHHDGRADFEALEVVDSDAGATGQIVCDALDAWGEVLTERLAVPLYVAILADTGSFNYGKTSPHTHRVAARLLEAGVRPLEVHGLLQGNKSLRAIRAGGAVLGTLTIDEADPRLAHATMTHAQYRDGGEDALDMLDLVNHTISLSGVLAGALFVEAGDRSVRLSLRSKGATSVVEVARELGGGGHRNAAGASMATDLARARPEVLGRLRAQLAAQHGPPAP